MTDKVKNTLVVRVGQSTDKGLKDTNEDCCGIRIPDGELLKSKGVAALVADGVSSSDGARLASESTVISFLNDYFSTTDTWTIQKSAEQVLFSVNKWLNGEGLRKYGTEYDMLTTLSVLILKSSNAHIFHVGDTRIYLLRKGKLKCLTKDHSMRLSSGKDVLNRAMGADSIIKIDYQSLPVEAGDVFLLATDGVYSFLNEEEIISVIENNLDEPEQITRMLVKKSLQNKSDDNLTCQIIAVDKTGQLTEEEFLKTLTELPFPPPLSEDDLFEGYKILRELHSTKRTQVYVALDIEKDKKVILKTPSVNYVDDIDYINSFLHEQWIGKRIKSPHVASISSENRKRKFLYYEMEFLDGQNLRHWMDENKNPTLNEVREILSQIVTGLRAFHRKEMVHRDLKPENIIIDKFGTVKIIDFGTVRVLGLEEEYVHPIVTENNMVGTLNYTAPEVFKGSAGTFKSDQYALAVIAYEMLTGQLPFGERKSWEKSLKELKNSQYRPARYYNDNIPFWIDKALEKSLNENPTMRYMALSEMMLDLREPNPDFKGESNLPLIERNPLVFWKYLSAILAIIALIEFYLIIDK